MPRSTVVEDDPYPLPKDTLFPVRLISCESVAVPFTKKTGADAGKASSFTKWEWVFEVEDGDFVGTQFKASTEPKVTTATESAFLPLARPVVEALLGRPLEMGEDVDTDLLVGGHAMATVRHLEPKARKNGDGFWFNVELDEIFAPYGQNVTGASSQPLSGNVIQPSGDPWGQPTYDAPPF